MRFSETLGAWAGKFSEAVSSPGLLKRLSGDAWMRWRAKGVCDAVHALDL